jgi:Cu(I)/Ag(I) efflux system membrane fusion protein
MKNFILGFLVAAILLAGGYYIFVHREGKLAAVAEKRKTIKYICPMHPTYISDKPGDCPICGMKLVPMEPATPAQDHAGHESEATNAAADQSKNAASKVSGYSIVTIPQDRIQSMGITIAEARRMELDQSFRTYGRITYDETKVNHIHTKFDGYIEAIYANFVGQPVKKGEPLFSIYSPELLATQNEYLLALRAREQLASPIGMEGSSSLGNVDLVAAARQRLALWDIGEKDIEELEATRKPKRALTIFSPYSGYVTAKTALQGLRVMPGDHLYDIVDLSNIWVLADIYEINLPSIRLGQPASITLAYRPGKTWRGQITFINPTVDPATRTVKARLELSNPGNELKPDMYAEVVIGGGMRTGIAVPESAVIATGERNIVFIVKGDGVFEPREVTLGTRVKNLYEITKGISEGEKVVAGANFLLDSESQLKASVSVAARNHEHAK